MLSLGFVLDSDRSEGNGRPVLHDSAKVKASAKRARNVLLWMGLGGEKTEVPTFQWPSFFLKRMLCERDIFWDNTCGQATYSTLSWRCASTAGILPLL